MFEKVAEKFAEKIGQGVKKATEPIKNEVTAKVDNKVDLYSKVLRLGVLALIFLEGVRRTSGSRTDQEPLNQTPTNIVINNYLPGKDGKE